MPLHTIFAQPSALLAPYVDNYWMLQNDDDTGKEVIILPDGRVDLFLSRSATEPFHITLLGIGTTPEKAIIPPRSLTFAISFRLPGADCILRQPMAPLLNSGQTLPSGFWGLTSDDLNDFNAFCHKADTIMTQHLIPFDDERKTQLFDLLYTLNGDISVKDLSTRIFWTSRQINRYFTGHFGLSLKAYCDILRFRASFAHIKAGKLFPEQDFADQSHFIKAVKKLSGVSPRQLSKNENDRFVQFTTLPPE